jgi:hypothetical protein
MKILLFRTIFGREKILWQQSFSLVPASRRLDWIESKIEREDLQAFCDISVIGKILNGPASYLALKGISQPL